ncbi:hypothetical protein TrVE_jg3750 [Triparma verrucosa]|uniref:Fatty acid hydroxylase domain-containing protein n=1 Tax=Triparma verrucosa TaxID=1606542 RepID=A0A9W7B2K6_9STRA|nr:hypothetical protein TrVE_jg3750 [Triparma verrucosa]
MCPPQTRSSGKSGNSPTAAKSGKHNATSTSLGFSPRVVPRPAYPPFSEFLISIVKEVFWQGGVHGIMCAYIFFPLYAAARSKAVELEISDQVFFALATSATHSVLYILCNFTFQLFDDYNWFQDYKLERKPYQKAKPALVKKMAVEAFIGQAVTGPIAAYFLYPLFLHFGMLSLDAPLPSAVDMFKTFVIGHVFNDVGFYWTHRIAHMKSIYKYVHKQHHEFAGTIGFAAEYANPLEVIISNQIPTVGGVLFFATHPLCVWVWIGLRLQQTYEAHSGYCFEGHILNTLWFLHADSAAHHDHHHTANQGNFGGLYTDWLFGTMDHYQALGGRQGYIDQKVKQK